MKIGSKVQYIGPELVENFGLGVFYHSPKNATEYTIRKFVLSEGVLTVFLVEHTVGTNIYGSEVGIPAGNFRVISEPISQSFVIGNHLIQIFIN